jgi:3-oxoacyl-(acyl-carrier-protein) synthase
MRSGLCPQYFPAIRCEDCDVHVRGFRRPKLGDNFRRSELIVISGKYTLESGRTEDALRKLEGRIKAMRLVHEIERLAIAAAGNALLDSGLEFPAGSVDTALFLAIDDSVEDIKNEYLQGVLDEGILGASPLLFPFTSANSLSAQVSIALDLRGECIVMPMKRINGSSADVIQYATECIAAGYAKIAIIGLINTKDRNLSIGEGRYSADFLIIEGEDDAVRRGARIYNSIVAGNRASF